MEHTGELIALLTAALWTVTAMAFEKASKRIGSLFVNISRLIIAFLLFSILSLVRTGHIIPMGFEFHQWLWLSISGLIGFVIGDYCLFKAYALLGSRIASLFMALAPPFAAILGGILLNESFGIKAFFGMMVTLIGIIMVILYRDKSKHNKKVFKLKFSKAGIFLAIGGAIGQAVGLVFSKYGMQESDPFLSSQIRVMAAIFIYSLIISFTRKWKDLTQSMSNRLNLKLVTTGSFFGPFLGVSLSLMSVQYTSTGIASTIMATVPVMIIIPAIIFFKEKVRPIEIFGAFLAFTGVAIFFI